jgi:Spy/CpxP family protein refolding chaperone
MTARNLLGVIAAATLLSAATPASLGFGRSPVGEPGAPSMRPQRSSMLPLHVLVSVMTPDQRTHLDEIMATDRPAMRTILDAIHAAHDALATRVLGPGPLTAADLDPQLKEIAALRDRLLQQALRTTLAVRALLTPEQLAEASGRLERLRELQAEMRSLVGPPSGPHATPAG